MNLEALFNRPINRRTSIKIMTSATLAIAAGQALTQLAAAEEPTKVIVGSDGREWVISPARPIPWSDVNWYPYSTATGQPVLYSENGPLAKFDQFVDKIYGKSFHTVEAEKEITNTVLALESNSTNRSTGHCDSMAAASINETEPVAGGIEGFPDLYYSQSDRKGLLTAFYSITVPIMLNPDKQTNIDLMIERFIKTGEPFVVEDPEGRGGEWFRATYAVSKDKQTLAVTNFGSRNLDVPRSNIRDADIHLHPKIQAYDPKYQPEVDKWKFLVIPELHDNYKMVKHFVTGKAS